MPKEKDPYGVPLEVFENHKRLSKDSDMFFGAHTSAAGGVDKAVEHCIQIGGTAFATFLKNQKRWVSPPLEDNVAKRFGSSVNKWEIDRTDQILPHGSYLINLGGPEEDKRKKAYDCFLDDLKRCEMCGIGKYNLHPGSALKGNSKDKSISYIAENINQALEQTSNVKVLLETMAGQGYVVGSTFEDLRDIISKIHRTDRIGVCLDTCHIFSAGFDIRSADKFQSVLDQFHSVVGLKYLLGVHCNDSKCELGSLKDRHEFLGFGEIGLDCFKFLSTTKAFKGIPIILETPDDSNGFIWAEEIKLLYEMSKRSEDLDDKFYAEYLNKTKKIMSIHLEKKKK